MNPISSFDGRPVGFGDAFFNPDQAGTADYRNRLFHHLFFDQYLAETDDLFDSILQGQINADYSFLSNTLNNAHYRKKSVITYITDFLTQNKAEKFYLFLYRIDSLWQAKVSPSAYHHLFFLNEPSSLRQMSDEMHTVLNDFFEHSFDPYTEKLSKNDDLHDVSEYFSYIQRLRQHKPSYAFALLVLWVVLNVHVIYLLSAIKKIIIFKDEAETSIAENKKYIIKSTLNDDLYLSILKTLEPLSLSETIYTERELLYSVNSGKFHSNLSVFQFQKVSQDEATDETILDEILNSPNTQRFFRRVINNLREIFVERVAEKIQSILSRVISPLLGRKTTYFIKVNNKYLHYPGWFSQTRIELKPNSTERRSQWFITESNIVGLYNAFLIFFAIDIPNGGQFAQSLMWCFFSIGQSAQNFEIHEVIDWNN